VNRGWACTAKACPPINRYRVPAEVSTRKNSFQSSFRCKVSEPRLAEPLDRGEAFFRGRLLEVGEVETVCFFETRDPDDPLNGHLHRPTIPSAAAASSLNRGFAARKRRPNRWVRFGRGADQEVRQRRRDADGTPTTASRAYMTTFRFGDFEWDEAKARANLRKHGVSFSEAATCFLDPRSFHGPRQGLSRPIRLDWSVAPASGTLRGVRRSWRAHPNHQRPKGIARSAERFTKMARKTETDLSRYDLAFETIARVPYASLADG
jgi:hypothetical protein